MSICRIGLEAKLKRMSISVTIKSSDPLVRLANAINWQEIASIAEPDLKCTAKGFWMLGRRLYLRTHLGVMILQGLLKGTDRGIEERIGQAPILQVFCGRGIVPFWKCPDHTKIEEFRNRLQPQTHQAICHAVLRIARELGFADPSWMDIDSTVQEANMAYPADVSIMKKLTEKGVHVLNFLKEMKKKYLPKIVIKIEKIRKKAHGYFFLPKNTSIELRRKAFREYHQLVKKELAPLIGFLESMTPRQLQELPWNIRNAIEEICASGWRYLLDVGHFVRNNKIKEGKILSLHLRDVACIKKGKAGKDKEFGRVFQLGRIGGNFLIPFTCTSVRMSDKTSLLPAIQEHQKIFGDSLKEIGSDKGYYTKNNIKQATALSINSDGLQRPANCRKQLKSEVIKPLRDRRAGIEPLIQHAKLFGLGKSKMKSDRATLASGYRSVTAFNLNQLSRHMTKAAVPRAQKIG